MLSGAWSSPDPLRFIVGPDSTRKLRPISPYYGRRFSVLGFVPRVVHYSKYSAYEICISIKLSCEKISFRKIDVFYEIS